jgi:hypothetical protein
MGSITHIMQDMVDCSTLRVKNWFLALYQVANYPQEGPKCVNFSLHNSYFWLNIPTFASSLKKSHEQPKGI